MEKKTFIEPEVTKVEFEFSEVIAASGSCVVDDAMAQIMIGDSDCATA